MRCEGCAMWAECMWCGWRLRLGCQDSGLHFKLNMNRWKDLTHDAWMAQSFRALMTTMMCVPWRLAWRWRRWELDGLACLDGWQGLWMKVYWKIIGYIFVNNVCMESAAICEDRLQTICREGLLVGLLLHEGDVETRGIHLSAVRLRDSAQSVM